jgi:pimeloyl-ACP methyl ester carboxylesterase
MKHLRWIFSVAPLWATAACGASVSGAAPDGGADVLAVRDTTPNAPVDARVDASVNTPVDASVDAPPAVDWTPCPLHTEGDGPDAECANVPVPLDPSRPDGESVTLFVKRYRPKGGRGLRALWMLQGGPGASGHVFEGLSEAFATRFPDVDYYMPDHRGTGRSTRLGCAAQEAESSDGGIFITDAEWPACLDAVRATWGDRLMAFNATNAAHDLGRLIAATRTPAQPVFVFGVSYGTYLAHRYLQLFPRQADGVVFDSVAPPGISLFRQDADAHEAARDFFAACDADSVCRGHFDRDPWTVAEGLVTRLRDGHCAQAAVPAAPTHVLFRRTFASMLMDPGLRAYVPAVVRRADRCAPRDVAALQVFLRGVSRTQPVTEELRLWSWVLSQNILQSEFNESPPPTAEALEAIRESAVASRDVTASMQIHLGRWPVYPLDRYARAWADSDAPMLFLQGGLDPATLLRRAREMRPHFTRANQHWVEVPTATHTVVASSPFVDEMGDPRSCGTRLLMRFIEAPTAPLDTGCVARVRPLDFSLPRTDLNVALFNTANAWD